MLRFTRLAPHALRRSVVVLFSRQARRTRSFKRLAGCTNEDHDWRNAHSTREGGGDATENNNKESNHDGPFFVDAPPAEAAAGMTLTSILAIAAWVSGAIYLASSDRSSPSSESTSRNGNHDGKKRAAALALAQGRSFPTLSDLERQGAYELIAEGGMNMVYASAGKKGVENFVIRMRKQHHELVLYDEEFRRQVVLPLFQNSNIQVPTIYCAPPSAVKRLTNGKGDTKAIGGKIYVSRLQNLLTVEGQSDITTVEIKPKCGLQEVETLPSRFQMLQYKKLHDGEISKITHYNPVDLFRTRSTKRALDALFDNPQHFLRVFKDGRLVFGTSANNGEILAPEPGNEPLLSKNETAELVDDIAGVIASDPVWTRLLYIQGWAAGKTAQHANALLEVLREQLRGKGKSGAEVELTINDYVATVDAAKVRAWTPDESGMRHSEREGIKLREQVVRSATLPQGSQGDLFSATSRKDLETQIRAYLCRFLLGRMAMDVSVMISFAEDKGSPERMTALRSSGFKQIGRGTRQMWYRLVLVDTDAKPIERIPGYATQLEEYERIWRAALRRELQYKH